MPSRNRIVSINNHLDVIQREEKELSGTRTGGPSLHNIRIDEKDHNKEDFENAFHELIKYKIQGYPMTEKQHEAFEYAIDELAVIIEDTYGIDVSSHLENITFSYIEPFSK